MANHETRARLFQQQNELLGQLQSAQRSPKER